MRGPELFRTLVRDIARFFTLGNRAPSLEAVFTHYSLWLTPAWLIIPHGGGTIEVFSETPIF